MNEEDIRAAHQRDLEVQTDLGVRYLTGWFNEPRGRAFGLVEAPDNESAAAPLKASDGLLPHEMMGDWEANVPDMARIEGAVDSGLQAIMFTDLEASIDDPVRVHQVASIL